MNQKGNKMIESKHWKEVFRNNLLSMEFRCLLLNSLVLHNYYLLVWSLMLQMTSNIHKHQFSKLPQFSTCSSTHL